MKTHQVVLIILAILAQCKNPQAMNLKINPAYDQFRKDSVSGFTFLISKSHVASPQVYD